jgi:hypothetical protein
MDRSHLLSQKFGEDLDVSGLVDHLTRGIELLIDLRTDVRQLPAELERRLLAVQELRDDVGRLIAGGLFLCRFAAPHQLHDLGEHRALGIERPFVRLHRRRPVQIQLRIPLAHLALFVERVEPFVLGFVGPGPMQRDRDVDIDTTADVFDDRGICEVDDLEIPE